MMRIDTFKRSTSVKALLGAAAPLPVKFDLPFMTAAGTSDAALAFALWMKPVVHNDGLFDRGQAIAVEQAGEAAFRFADAGVPLDLRMVYLRAFADELKRQLAVAHGVKIDG